MEITTPADDQILITREFDAPKHLVYRVWTTPELVRRWWSGHRGTTTEVELDLRPGGRWRYVIKTNDGAEVGFHGEYREIVPEERIVYTEVFEMPGVALDSVDGPLNTATFTALDGDRTRLELLTVTGSRELRDTILQSGMEVGVREQMVIIQELADSLR
ncbi:SRPBCC family protein [Amycolatopsis sp. OK19-0408]|uniref:SRPBCC family protein n=1 Tax=Amycolatopsis iheyensis TaxID=2945988 RepID=A0A9X2N7N5_9PSEU|nr:SRPBCC family protein [Amycolatopsis iheyensis]MCR6483811.1 SRPBCC family protein [Amycolatopsis iheyensis]